MSGSIKSRFAKLVKLHLAPMFRESGFQGKDRKYVHEFNELSWLIALTVSRFNTNDEFQFTLDLGIYVPGVVSTYLNQPESPVMDISYCCVTARLGLLHKDRFDVWWVLRAFDDVVAISSEIVADIGARIREDGIPFFNRFRDCQSVIDFLSQSKIHSQSYGSPRNEVLRLAYLGIIYYLRGDRADAFDVLLHAREGASNGPLAEHIDSLFNRLVK